MELYKNKASDLNIRRMPHKKFIRKWSRQRVTKGFSDWDLFNLDNYLIHIIPAALDELAKTTYGYPEGKANSLDEWKSHLEGLASEFRRIDENASNGVATEILQEELNEAFLELSKIFWALWD